MARPEVALWQQSDIRTNATDLLLLQEPSFNYLCRGYFVHPDVKHRGEEFEKGGENLVHEALEYLKGATKVLKKRLSTIR